MIQIDVGGNTREYFGVISRESIGGVFRLENMIDIPR